MDKKRRILRAGVVLGVALAAGHLVQTMKTERDLAEAARMAVPTKIEKVSAGPEALGPEALGSETASPAPAADLPSPQLAALTNDLPALPPLKLLPALPELAAPKAEPPAPAADCTPHLSLTAAPWAMISVALDAPCAAGQRVVLRHAGLAVAEKLDARGQLALDLPAFDKDGAVSVLFDDAKVLRDAVPMPDLAKTRRFAVQWMAGDAFALRVIEGGQAYGDKGNVTVDTPVSTQGGYMVALGDPSLDLPMMAQVYTWPADPAARAEPVIEASVTDATCGREMLGETILATGGTTAATDLTVAMPDCDAIGDILVLNNLVGDVTLAATN